MYELELLLYACSDINIIQIDFLKINLIIDETNKMLIRGISNKLIRTLRTIQIPIIINNNNLIVNFHVVG